MMCSLLLVLVSGVAGPADAWLAEPPAERRILKIVHSLPDAPEEQHALLETLARQGFGGIVTNVSFEEYLQSEAKWKAFESGVERAKLRGMALWLYDEKGYPSGTAGGLTLRDHPEWEARGLYYAIRDTGEGPVAIDLPPGALVQAKAYRLDGEVLSIDDAVELSSSVSDRKLLWQAPAGRWRMVVITEDRLFEGTHATASFSDHIPQINMLMAEPTERFLELTHAGYARLFGDDLGRYFVSTFTDEPSLMSLFMKEQPWVCVPWSGEFAEVFRTRRGCDPMPLLPLLVTGEGSRAQSVRYDFWLTVGELVSENFFGRIQDWCGKHNILSGGHLLCEESPAAHVPLYGDFLRCARRLTAPSIDCLTSVPEEVPWYIARLVSSAAELEGRKVTMCETSDFSQRYRAPSDTRPVRNVTEEEIRGTCNRLILNGITTVTSYYSFEGLSDEQLVRLNQWVGRCAAALSGGVQAADIAYVYPTESLWIRFRPSRLWTHDAGPEIEAVERTYRNGLDDLFAACRDVIIFDSRALVEAKVEGGVLQHGGLAPRVVVLPRVDTLPLAAWENLATFWETGGMVVALGSLPANSEKEFPSARVREVAARIFGGGKPGEPNTNASGGVGLFLSQGMEGLLPAALGQMVDPDVELTDGKAPLRATHRSIDGREVYLVINDSREPWEGRISFRSDGPGEALDPATGSVTSVGSSKDISLRLEPFGGMLYRFAKAAPARRRAPTMSVLEPVDGLPELSAPSCIRGEFVQGDVQRVEGGVDPAWRADAAVTRSDVDTFLFANFDFPQSADVSRGDFIEFRAAAIPSDAIPVDLLVILVDADGREFVANAGCRPATDAPIRCCVPLSRFERAGWKPQPDGPLNTRALETIRVGWGGYKGRSGERVYFELTTPRVMKTAAMR